MIHLLPAGGVPQVQGALSPVPPRLPHFATPRPVRHLATVVAGAYPLRCPPDAWSPGLPAQPGPYYWLVASETPMGWRGGCLAAGLVCSTVCYYCLGGCSALVVCARRSRLVWGVGAGAGSCFSTWAPPCPRVPRGACCGLSRPDASYLCLPVRHSMRSVRSAGSVSLPFRSTPRVRCVCVRSCSRGVRAPPPLRVGVARTLRTVLVQAAGSAVPHSLCPSAFPARVPCSAYLALGGVAWSLRPLTLLGVACPPAGRPAFLGWLCLLWGRHQGAWGGGASRLGVGRPGLGALPGPTARPCGVRPGPPTDLLWVRQIWAWGPVTNPTARAPASWLCGLWGGMRAPWGGASCLRVGRLGSGALPGPTTRPWGVRPGPATHWLWVWGEFGWEPPAYPTARALASWLCALSGRHEGARGGGVSCLGVGRPRLGTLSRPTASPWGLRPGPSTHWQLVRGVWAWQPATSLTAALLLAGFARRWVPRGRPGQGASCLGVGRPGSGAVPRPAACPRGALPTVCGCGVCGHGDLSPTPKRALLRAGFACCGGGTRTPEGGASCLRVRCPGSGALPHPTARPLVLQPGPATQWLQVRGGGWPWGPLTYPIARALASWLSALWGRHKGAPGGRLLPLCGASEVGRSLSPDCPSLGRAPGVRYQQALGARGLGVETRH